MMIKLCLIVIMILDELNLQIWDCEMMEGKQLCKYWCFNDLIMLRNCLKVCNLKGYVY